MFVKISSQPNLYDFSDAESARAFIENEMESDASAYIEFSDSDPVRADAQFPGIDWDHSATGFRVMRRDGKLVGIDYDIYRIEGGE